MICYVSLSKNWIVFVFSRYCIPHIMMLTLCNGRIFESQYQHACSNINNMQKVHACAIFMYVRAVLINSILYCM
jgi:hypothetical protein